MIVQNRESTSRVSACESCVHPSCSFNQSSAGFICNIRVWLRICPLDFFYCLPLRKITPRNFLFLWSKIIRNSSSTHLNFFSFKRRPNLSLYDEYSRTLIWFFKDSKFAYKTTKFYPKWYVLIRTKPQTSISRKTCYVKSGLVEQLSSQYFSLGTLSNDDDDGSENFAKKINLRSFKLNRVYLDPHNMSNAGDVSWSWILKGFKFKKRKENSSSYVHVLHNTSN